MAEAVANHIAGGKLRAFSAGSQPAGKVQSLALQVLEESHIPANGARSKSWDEFTGQAFDLVVTVCDAAAAESCPVFLGPVKKLHWSTPDPAKATGTEEQIDVAFDDAFNMLKEQIEGYLKNA